MLLLRIFRVTYLKGYKNKFTFFVKIFFISFYYLYICWKLRY